MSIEKTVMMKKARAVKFDTLQRVILYVKDAQKSATWYGKTLGLKIRCAEPGWAELETVGATLSLHGGRTEKNSKQQTHVSFRVDDFDAAYKHLKKHETRVSAIFSPCHGTRGAAFSDPDGNSLGIEGK